MISIIIINNLDSVKYLQETVLSIEEKITDTDYEIIIVNTKIKTEDESRPKLKVYYLDTDNLAKVKNFAVSKTSSDNLLFIKSGVVIKVNPFTYFFEKFKNRNYGAVALKLYDYKNHFKINFWKEVGLSEETEEAAINKKIFEGNTHKSLELENKYHDIASVGRVSSEAMFINKKNLLEAGGFNEYLLGYYDDAELCKRLLQKKFVNYFYPFCKLVDLRLYESELPVYLKARLRYYKSHNSFVTRFFLRSALIVKYILLLLTFNPQNRHSLKSVLFPY
ncbi:MAG: hypothetical protein JST55_06265 [Bacteroidetes bacterium]|nr:hypothetical protein [Bacteroidota bacterium]